MAATGVFAKAGVPASGAAWAQLRVLAAAYFPERCHLLTGLEMAAQAKTTQVAAEYWSKGGGQLAQWVVSGFKPATVVSQAARDLCAMPCTAAERERRAARLLADAAGLA